MYKVNKSISIGAILISLGLLSGCSSTSCQPSLSVQNNVVIDKKTNLMWTKYDAFSKNTSGFKGGWIDWSTAIDTASKMDLNGYTDWRVPTTKELQTIYNNECEMDGTTMVQKFTLHSSPIFDNPTYPYFWTSDTKGEKAIGIDFRNGKIWEIKKKGGNTVRYVRNIK